MLKVYKKKIILCIGCIFSLFLGAVIYALLREEAYISQIVAVYVDLSRVKNAFILLDNDFVKYYLPDYLWAFSLCCGILIISNPTSKKEVLCYSSITFWVGTLYEILQKVKLIGGTGDVIDIILYFLAALTVSIIYIKE